MKRVLSLVLALVLVLGMMPTAFAADATGAQNLYDNGFISGKDGATVDAKLDVNAMLTRAQLAALIAELNGAKEEAAAFAQPADFTDADTFQDWAKPYIAYAQENGWMKGYPDGSFGPDKEVKAIELAAVLMNALGYTVDTVEKYNTVLADAAALGIIVEGDALTRGEAFEAMWTAVSEVPMNTEEAMTLGVYLGKLEAPVVVPTELTLDTATSTNNKEIVLTFNNEVDADTAEDTANYTLTGGLTVATAAADANVVTLTLTAAASQQASSDLTVKNVIDVNGLKVADTTKTVKFFDVTVPTVASITVTGPKTLKLTFSEPITSTAITSTSNFSIDNNTYSIATVAASGTHSVIVTLGTTLPAGSHTITVNNTTATADPALKDFAGFFVAKTAVPFEYAQDTTAPTVSIVSAKQNEVKIKFSKAIDAATQANLSVYHTYNKNASYVAASYVWGSDNQTVTATFTQNYLPVGTATVYINAGTSPNVLKDGWGNAFESVSLSSTITADVTKPEVTKVEAKSATSIEVTFSESVSGATTASNFVLKDSANVAVSVTSSVLKSGTTSTYVLTTGTMNGGSYNLTISNIKDTSVSANAMDSSTFVVTVNDLIKPTVTATGVMSTDKKKIVVSFSEAMATSGEGSILNLSNYQVQYDGGTWTDLTSITGTTIAAGAGNKSAIITFTSAQSVTLGGANDNVRVARVADLAGNKTANFTTDVAFSADDITTANISKIKATSTTTVQFEVNTTLTAIDVSKFNVQVGVTDKAAQSATYVNGDNTATVTVTVLAADKFATDLADLTNIEFTAGGLTTALGTSNSGTVTQAVTAATADYVAPAISTVATVDGDTDGKIDRVDVTFTEALYVASVADADFTVEGYEVLGVAVSGGNVVEITVKELSSIDSAATPKVTLVGAVSDNTNQRNSAGPIAAVTATDGVAAIVTGDFTNVDTKIVVVSFSEAMDAATLVQGNFSSVTGGAITNFVKATDNKSVTITFTNGLVATNNVVVAGAVTDVAGNASGATLTK